MFRADTHEEDSENQSTHTHTHKHGGTDIKRVQIDSTKQLMFESCPHGRSSDIVEKKLVHMKKHLLFSATQYTYISTLMTGLIPIISERFCGVREGV